MYLISRVVKWYKKAIPSGKFVGKIIAALDCNASLSNTILQRKWTHETGYGIIAVSRLGRDSSQRQREYRGNVFKKEKPFVSDSIDI